MMFTEDDVLKYQRLAKKCKTIAELMTKVGDTKLNVIVTWNNRKVRYCYLFNPYLIRVLLKKGFMVNYQDFFNEGYENCKKDFAYQNPNNHQTWNYYLHLFDRLREKEILNLKTEYSEEDIITSAKNNGCLTYLFDYERENSLLLKSYFLQENDRVNNSLNDIKDIKFSIPEIIYFLTKINFLELEFFKNKDEVFKKRILQLITRGDWADTQKYYNSLDPESKESGKVITHDHKNKVNKFIKDNT